MGRGPGCPQGTPCLRQKQTRRLGLECKQLLWEEIPGSLEEEWEGAREGRQPVKIIPVGTGVGGDGAPLERGFREASRARGKEAGLFPTSFLWSLVGLSQEHRCRTREPSSSGRQRRPGGGALSDGTHVGS